MDADPVAGRYHLADGVDVGEIELRIDALGVAIERQGDEVDIAGALAVAEEAAFDAQRRTEDDLLRLWKAIARRDGLFTRDREAFVNADLAFHAAIVEASGNPVLIALWESFLVRLREALLAYMNVLDLAHRIRRLMCCTVRSTTRSGTAKQIGPPRSPATISPGCTRGWPHAPDWV